MRVSGPTLLAGFAHGWQFGQQGITVWLPLEQKDTVVERESVSSELWLGERWALEEKPRLTTCSGTVLGWSWESRCGLIFLQ